MASSINSVLNIGAGALYASQTAIQTTGNNIANVNTEGYSRQKVRFEENPSLDFYPGQMGTGVRAAEVYRMFDRFVEKSYLDKAGMESRWKEQYGLLTNVEAVFNEANSPGIAYSANRFFNSWQQLSQDAASSSNRVALLSDAQALANYVSEADDAMAYMQKQIDSLIAVDVDRANKLMHEIAELNKQINQHIIPGQNNPNSLMDQRDAKVRALGQIIDVDVIDRGAGKYTVHTKSGMTLVQEEISYKFEFQGPKTEQFLASGSSFTGSIGYSGSDTYEYTVEVVQAGSVDATGTNAPGSAQYRVSLDGGRTWLKDESGAEIHYTATDAAHKNNINDLGIYFDTGAGNLAAGDRFEIVPKSAVYWNSPTTGLINISPQAFSDGTSNSRRMQGGTLTAYFDFRDNQIGTYRDQLDTYARSMIWEVNRIHSQGVGLEKNISVLGDYRVDRADVPLGGTMSGLTWADRLQNGNLSVAIYDKTTGEPVLTNPGVEAVFNLNFDPATDSLDDVVTAVNAFGGGGFLSASVVDGRLEIHAVDPDQTFAFQGDTSGLLAGLGINTFYKGEHAGEMAVTERIVSNPGNINAGRVNGGAEGNQGDNITAREIAQLATKSVTIRSATGSTSQQSMIQFYASIVSKVGSDTATAKYNTSFFGAMAKDLRDRQDENSGVNLDEEMTSLVRFQNSYKAAAKLITTADQMLQTILGLKQ